MKIREVQKASYAARHMRYFFRYLTPRKITNLFLNMIELKLRIPRPTSTPFYIKVEPTPLCQLSCPGCAHGNSDLNQQLTYKMHMGIEKFQEVIDALHPTLIGISMSLRGEPLMGKNLTEMIAYAHAKNIAVSFPTNLSLPLTENRIKDLIESGLDAMYVALDGASHETYGRYRVGGNFSLVVNNVKAIARMKKALGKHNPTLIWKFVVFDHNRHELETVKQTYKDMGFDTYEIAHNYNGEKRKSHVGQMKQSMVERKQGCYWAWHTTIIRADGEVHPCCKKMHHDFGLGNINENDLLDIWRNDAYAKLRHGFTTMNPEMLHPSCAQCLGLSAPTQPTVPLVRFPVEAPS